MFPVTFSPALPARRSANSMPSFDGTHLNRRVTQIPWRWYMFDLICLHIVKLLVGFNVRVQKCIATIESTNMSTTNGVRRRSSCCEMRKSKASKKKGRRRDSIPQPRVRSLRRYHCATDCLPLENGHCIKTYLHSGRAHTTCSWYSLDDS